MASLTSAFRRLLRFLGLGRVDPPATPPSSPHALEESRPVVGQPMPSPTTLAMPQLVDIAGAFPSRSGGSGSPCFTLAMVETFAGSIAAYGAPRAQGQIEQLNNPPSNQALFSVLGTTFGGNAINDFGLPNLNGRVAVGGEQVGTVGQGTLAMSWVIWTGQSTQMPLPGTLAMFAAGWAPDGWAICDGSMLAISQHIPLFEAIGCTFGGNNVSIFALPNFQSGAAPIGAGQGPGRAPVTLGQQTAGAIAGVGVNYLIAVEGPNPPNSGPGALPDTGPYLGQVIAYCGAAIPAGWAVCDGSLINVSDNQPLFELIGTTYGGDGKSNFALPDLRGLMVTGLAG